MPFFNGSALSFHAYGLALDLNAPENGYSPTGATVPHTIPEVVGEIARTFGAEWGGVWSRPKDYMHLEVHLAPRELQDFVTRDAHRSEPAPTYGRFARVRPGTRVIGRGSAGTDVQFVQAVARHPRRRLLRTCDRGARHGVPEDARCRGGRHRRAGHLA